MSVANLAPMIHTWMSWRQCVCFGFIFVQHIIVQHPWALFFKKITSYLLNNCTTSVWTPFNSVPQCYWGRERSNQEFHSEKSEHCDQISLKTCSNISPTHEIATSFCADWTRWHWARCNKHKREMGNSLRFQWKPSCPMVTLGYDTLRSCSNKYWTD